MFFKFVSWKFIVSGYVIDGVFVEMLIGVNIFESCYYQGIIINFYGFYSIMLFEGEVWLSFFYLGYIGQ